MFTIFTVHVFQPKKRLPLQLIVHYNKLTVLYSGLRLWSKTRKEDEVKDALTVLVNAVKKKRQESESTTA